MMLKIEDIDHRLLWLLRKAGEEWGPMGVFLAAGKLAQVEIEEDLKSSSVDIVMQDSVSGHAQ